MPNRLTLEEIHLLEALLSSLSETGTRKGFVEVEAVKDADSQVYAHLSDQLKKLGIKPTPQRVQALFDRLVQKGNNR